MPNVVNADINVGMRRARTFFQGSRTNISRSGSAQRKIKLAQTVLSIRQLSANLLKYKRDGGSTLRVGKNRVVFPYICTLMLCSPR